MKQQECTQLMTQRFALTARTKTEALAGARGVNDARVLFRTLHEHTGLNHDFVDLQFFELEQAYYKRADELTRKRKAAK